jgi:putative FmdB family regulatory protein
MPIYEYECAKCGKRTSFLTTRVSEKVETRCRHCGGTKMRRLMSRFAMPRSEDSRLDQLSDPSRFSDLDEKDPRSVARMMRNMGKEMGDEFGGAEFDEAIDEMEASGDMDEEGSGGSGDDGV